MTVTTPAFRTQNYRPVPTAPAWPGLGALPYLAREPFAYMRAAQQAQGDIFRINLGVTDAIVMTQPRHAQYVLRDNVRNYRKGGNMWNSVRNLFGNGLVVSEGDFWLRQRRMMAPQFHRRRLAGLFDLMSAAIEEQFAAWPAQTDSFDFTSAINRMTMAVITRTMFGTGLSQADFDRLREAMTFAMDFMLLGMVTESLPSWLPLPGKRRYDDVRRTFDDIVYGVIARGRDGADDNSLLAMLLAVEDAETGERMSDQQVRDEVATVFVAGYETTAIALAWAADFLARDTALQDRLAGEIDAVTGGTPPELATLRELGLARRTFQEALRIRPSAWFLPRLAVEDDEIDGYVVPAGAQVAILINQIHNHPEHWQNPEKFDPDRFEDEAVKARHAFAYVPFGAGQRQCIGRDFAYMEGQLILTRLLQQYRLLPVGSEPARPQLSTTLRPAGGMTVGLAPR